MQTVAVAEVLAPEGLAPPVLNVLVPNAQNYTALLMQPQGDIEISGAGVCNRDRELAQAQFDAFLRDARATDADLENTGKGNFDPHRPYQTCLILHLVAENLAPFQWVSSKTLRARESTARRCASPMTCAYFCKVIRESL
jgi:hypothetical protein